ncbi:MAG: hypothetical protein KF744_16165 [Taibaiella sp.]|nr:hypothetical protein [Taibaiella sp.]
MGLQLAAKVTVIALAMSPGTRLCAQQYTERNQPWTHSDSTTCFMIMKHQKTCLKCFNEVYNAIRKKFDGQHYKIASLSLVDSSVYARKLESAYVRELMPGISPILFEYRNKNDSNLFDQFQPDVTPAIVILNKGRKIYIPYDSMYKDGKINKNLGNILSRAIE